MTLILTTFVTTDLKFISFNHFIKMIVTKQIKSSPRANFFMEMFSWTTRSFSSKSFFFPFRIQQCSPTGTSLQCYTNKSRQIDNTRWNLIEYSNHIRTSRVSLNVWLPPRPGKVRNFFFSWAIFHSAKVKNAFFESHKLTKLWI